MDDRAILDLSHALWKLDPRRVNFETSFGTLAWAGPTSGTCHLVERDGALAGWARLTPAYDRIRRLGEWDVAPPSLAWMVDWRRADATDVLGELVAWAIDHADDRGQPLATSHAAGDDVAARALEAHGFTPEPTEPFGIYLQQPLASLPNPTPPTPPPDGYVLTRAPSASSSRRIGASA
jgi:hypothetical protein